MEVLRENFLEALPAIQSAIEECEFIAIDGEFTGIGTGLPSKVLFDTPAQRYSRLKRGLSDLIIIQYGICTFKWNMETKQYEAKPFNIYIFPRSYKGAEPFFHCQSSSLEFLASQGFDFNKLIYNGLSYMSPTQEASMRKKIEKFYSKNDAQKTPKSKEVNEDDLLKTKSPIFIPSTMKEFVEGICDQVKHFMEGEEKSLNLPRASAFKRKLTYEVIEERFSSGLHLETSTNEKDEKFIRVIKAGEEERQKLQDAKNAEKMAEFETSVGFLKIAQLLSKSQKLITGHNMLLDLMLTVGQFFTPLPDSYDEFKQIVQTLFPKIIDTKLLATSKPLNEKVSCSALGPLHQLLTGHFEEPEIVFSEGFKEYEGSTEKFHEAGYDAFCTGVCFAKMATQLCKMQHPTDERKQIDLNAELLNPFINRVYVMRINDLTYLTMDGLDVIPERKHVFHLNFPSGWKYADINKLFDDFGNVYTAFLDDTSAFVSLDKEENANAAIKKLIIDKDCGPCQAVTYRQFVGIDALDKYDRQGNDVKEDVDVHNKIKKRKRDPNDAPEEGEVTSSPEWNSEEAQEPVMSNPESNSGKVQEPKQPKRPKRAINKQKNGDTPLAAKEFYEPDNW